MACESITTKAVVKGGVRKESAWRMLSDFVSYPSLARPINKVVIHQKGSREGISEWFVSLDNAPVRWMEKDQFDLENFGISFESIDGDFEHISGAWTVEDHNGEGIELGYRFSYDLGIPVIEENVGPVLKEKMKSNVETIVHSMAAHLSRSCVEERAFLRIPIGRYNTLLLDGSQIRARILNVGRRGIMFDCPMILHNREVEIGIDDMTFKAELCPLSMASTRVRAVFQKEMSEPDLQHCTHFLMTNNQRSHERKSVSKNSVVKTSGKTVLAHIIDVSPSGMLIKCFDRLEVTDTGFEVAGMAVAPKKKLFDADEKTLRVQFAQVFNEQDFDAFVAKLESPRVRPAKMQPA